MRSGLRAPEMEECHEAIGKAAGGLSGAALDEFTERATETRDIYEQGLISKRKMYEALAMHRAIVTDKT